MNNLKGLLSREYWVQYLELATEGGLTDGAIANDIVAGIEKAINYSHCCETLKCKEETAFDLWLKNFEKTEENLYWFNEETLYCIEAMKDVYNTEVKPTL